MAVWRIPNVTVIVKITDFDPGSHTITHEDLDGDIYTDRDTYYAVLNHLVRTGPARRIRPGRKLGPSISSGRGTPVTPTRTRTRSSRVERASTANGRHHLIIEGFDVRKFTLGMRAIGDQASHVTIRNNHVHLLRSNNWYALQVNGTDMLVEANAVTDCQRAVGILAGGENITVRNNLVKRTSRQGIWLMGVEHGEILDNRVVDIKGTHSNGISVYLHHQDILVAGNHVWDTNLALTYHGNNDPDFVNNLIIYNNLLENSVHSWGNGMRGVTVLNNTFCGRDFHVGRGPRRHFCEQHNQRRWGRRAQSQPLHRSVVGISSHAMGGRPDPGSLWVGILLRSSTSLSTRQTSLRTPMGITI